VIASRVANSIGGRSKSLPPASTIPVSLCDQTALLRSRTQPERHPIRESVLELSHASGFHGRAAIERVQFYVRCEERLKELRIIRVEADEASIMNVPTPRTKRNFFIVFLAGPRNYCERIPKSLCRSLQDGSGYAGSIEPSIAARQFG
jgi:hypothetical protein